MQDTPLEATHWGRWARQLPLSSAVPLLVTPPVVGGLLVGALRAASAFDDPAAADGAPRVSAPSDAASLRDRTASASTSGRGDRGAAFGASPLWLARQKARMLRRSYLCDALPCSVGGGMGCLWWRCAAFISCMRPYVQPCACLADV